MFKSGLMVLLLGIAGTAGASEISIVAGDKTQGFARYWEDYERCKAREEFTPERGEYETQDEYRRRVEALRVGCDTYRRIEGAQIEVAVSLSYDADAERFAFELPIMKGLRLQYDALVWDDFPIVLSKLPRDRWHIDDPTPKASAYKECTLRNASSDGRFITKIEPFRLDSWRGCMTYYRPGDEVAWRREQGSFFISDVTFYAYSSIEMARQLRDAEKQLIYRLSGTLLVPEQTFETKRVDILNKATGAKLITLVP